MKYKNFSRKIDDNKCYICKEEIGSEFYILDGNKICLKCYNSKHMASEHKKMAKRVFV